MSHLSPSELRVLAAYARIGDRGQAAASIGLTENSARNLLNRAYDKLGVRSAMEAYRALGWLVPPDEATVIRYEHGQALIAAGDRLERQATRMQAAADRLTREVTRLAWVMKEAAPDEEGQ